MSGEYDFVLDLPKGEESERTVAFMLYMKDGSYIEVKRDFIVSDSGNVAIEYEHNGKPSGIAITKATWWAIHLDGPKYNGETIVFIKTGRLFYLAQKYRRTDRDKTGGDNKNTKIITLPVNDLMSPVSIKESV